MREVLYEESANPVNLKTQKFFYSMYTTLMWVSIIVSFFFFILFTMIPALFWFLLAMSVISSILFGFFRTKIYYCVDCIFVSGSTRIVKVVNYKKRRKVIVFDASEVVQVGKMTSDSYKKLETLANVKKIYGTPNKFINDGFYVHLIQNNQPYILILECQETYLQHLVSFAGRQVIERDYK